MSARTLRRPPTMPSCRYCKVMYINLVSMRGAVRCFVVSSELHVRMDTEPSLCNNATHTHTLENTDTLTVADTLCINDIAICMQIICQEALCRAYYTRRRGRRRRLPVPAGYPKPNTQHPPVLQLNTCVTERKHRNHSAIRK